MRVPGDAVPLEQPLSVPLPDQSLTSSKVPAAPNGPPVRSATTRSDPTLPRSAEGPATSGRASSPNRSRPGDGATHAVGPASSRAVPGSRGRLRRGLRRRRRNRPGRRRHADRERAPRLHPGRALAEQGHGRAAHAASPVLDAHLLLGRGDAHAGSRVADAPAGACAVAPPLRPLVRRGTRGDGGIDGCRRDGVRSGRPAGTEGGDRQRAREAPCGPLFLATTPAPFSRPNARHASLRRPVTWPGPAERVSCTEAARFGEGWRRPRRGTGPPTTSIVSFSTPRRANSKRSAPWRSRIQPTPEVV